MIMSHLKQTRKDNPMPKKSEEEYTELFKAAYAPRNYMIRQQKIVHEIAHEALADGYTLADVYRLADVARAWHNLPAIVRKG